MVGSIHLINGGAPSPINLSPHTRPDALRAATGFNALLIEKMLNSSTDARAETNPDITLALKTSEYMYNTKMAEVIAASSVEINNIIAREIDNAKR
jgi:hypothetical protein